MKYLRQQGLNETICGRYEPSGPKAPKPIRESITLVKGSPTYSGQYRLQRVFISGGSQLMRR